MTVATACSSSAKVFAQAERLIRARSRRRGRRRRRRYAVRQRAVRLQLAGAGRRPSLAGRSTSDRRGINLGEAAGFALLERDAETGPWLLGYGESSDAHHMSTPHPEGLGARAALHDALESRAARRRRASTTSICTARRARRTTKSKRASSRTCFRPRTFASSTKGWTGSHARRGGHRRSGDQPARARARLAAGHAQHRRRSIRPAARRSAATTSGGARSAR